VVHEATDVTPSGSAMQLPAVLVDAQKMEAIGTLAAGVAHELNNPLAAIVAFADLLRRDERLPADMRADAEQLVAEAGRTRRIISNLLEFARRRPPERHPTALRALVTSVVELVSYSLRDGRIAIAVDLDGDLPLVELDRPQLQQVLVNLTLNAVQALSADGHGRVVIRGGVVPGVSAERVWIAVEDDGPGVAEEDRDRLFQPFFTTRTAGEGAGPLSGLGLAVSRAIVEAHGGSLGFEEPESGRGARFVVDLPIHASAERRPVTGEDREAVPAPAPAAEPARRRVLVLDDEPSIRAFLGKALPAHGIEVITAASGSEALELARTMRFDAMLCDHRMAGMGGPAVYRALERENPALAAHFVFMTGDVQDPELRAFAAERAITLLAKPFDLGAAVAAVRDSLDRPPTDRQRG